MRKVLPIEKAPKDGTEIIGIYKDGTEEHIRWNEDRYCMLGRRNGSYPAGWSSADPNVDSNLPLPDDDIFAFIEVDAISLELTQGVKEYMELVNHAQGELKQHYLEQKEGMSANMGAKE